MCSTAPGALYIDAPSPEGPYPYDPSGSYVVLTVVNQWSPRMFSARYRAHSEGMLTTSDLAQVLFTSSLQPSDDLSPDKIRTAIDDRLCSCDGDAAVCAAFVAQEAGDHPESFASRMRWALNAVTTAYRQAV
ncbi:hypothetical protein GCM10009555_057550 [Acrocarpospora macrocephala]|uniref:Uncharacterized protein n=2 Tax=Acrocarpospora macrocephala TaxID=150177 RepID=A0A5M3WJ36_9ACTN|nr:hypothetical protein Amac_019560 [Acrocarpospora macrocephala]